MKLPGEEEPTESTMTHDEIRQWHSQYNISWQKIFELDAEFWSLITIEQEEKAKKKKSGKQTNDLFAEFAAPQEPKDPEEEDHSSKKVGLEADGPSISLKIFLDYSIKLADKFKDVNKRLISALGIDTSNENVRIEWD